MEIIDIPSSPDLPPARRTRSQSRQPPPSKNGLRPAPKTHLLSEIIEISDSDDELPPQRVSPKRKKALDLPFPNPEPGPSNADAPLFGPPRAELLGDDPPEAGPSRNSPPGQTRNAALPLFYPSDDEREVAQRTVVIAPAVPPPPPPAFAAEPPALPVLEPVVPEIDPVDAYVARVIEIVPDVQPAHVLALIEQYIAAQPANVVELVLHVLLEGPGYPKIDNKGKRKRAEEGEDGAARGQPKIKVNYAQKDREYKGGPHYTDMALEQLLADFPYIPKPHVRTRLLGNNGFYAPAYFHLVEDQKKVPLPYKTKTAPSRTTGKGKAKHDPEFESEREWLVLKLQEDAAPNDAVLAEQMNEQEYKDTGDGIECGCCFSSYPFDKMIQCPEAHLFCNTCMMSYASNLLGEHNPNIVCMDQSGCKLSFPESELERFLSPKLLELYHRVKQRKEIEAAGLENLEECPFCEYKCVIENEMEKLFRCENTECGAVSCRECKKLDHLPKSCKEMEEDKHLDARHIIEEAMTRALMRNCPKCQKAFIKENGCNKMTCPNCHTMSCYICRKVISGYDHFNNPPPYSGRPDESKCKLWDVVEQRHAEEVTEAAKRALEEFKRDHPDVDPENIKVDLPPPVPAQPQHPHANMIRMAMPPYHPHNPMANHDVFHRDHLMQAAARAQHAAAAEEERARMAAYINMRAAEAQRLDQQRLLQHQQAQQAAIARRLRPQVIAPPPVPVATARRRRRR
ncbi:hypothetical protein BV22DRAFT_1028918 [Leucogyrophana mollusca]|uniref:Uncharacterized protein n=1 Tax=Leucogyrophana mollusca TaxID=85980 RepID=A0ACB8BW91_9AGAM|nr:hypothetical protein BV22DRAFT_1028918 [Leucogyrophana mollusca]